MLLVGCWSVRGRGRWWQRVRSRIGVHPLAKLLKYAPDWLIRTFARTGKLSNGLAAARVLESKTILAFDDIAAISRGQVVYRGAIDLRPTLQGIADGSIAPRTLFRNEVADGALGPELPPMPKGYYQEYVVPTPGAKDAGPMRIVMGAGGEIYFTPAHYIHNSFYAVWTP